MIFGNFDLLTFIDCEIFSLTFRRFLLEVLILFSYGKLVFSN